MKNRRNYIPASTPTLEQSGLVGALLQQIHDDLRIQHPEWVQPNGESPTCDSYEARLMELLSLDAKGLSWNTKDEESRFANAHRGDGQRFIVRADKKLSASLELERAIRAVTPVNQDNLIASGQRLAASPG
jgi:hypothetical protein